MEKRLNNGMPSFGIVAARYVSFLMGVDPRGIGRLGSSVSRYGFR